MASQPCLQGSQPNSPRTDARESIRNILSNDQAFAKLQPETRRDIAGALARISSSALDNEDAIIDSAPAPRAIAAAQNAGREFSGVATDRLASTTRDVLNAVSFPRFVTELITGVFKAMNDSNQQQLTAFVDLIRNVAQTTEGFADSNVGVSGARQWLAERFPGSYVVQGGDEDEFTEDLSGLSPEERQQRQAEIQAERDAATEIRLRPGAGPPTEAALRAALGVAEGETVSGANPEALLPFVRQILARNRQQLLATMVQMGMQRIVIESGRLNASMRFHIDTSSAASNDRGSQFDMRNTTEVGAGARFGPWGAEAKVQNTIGYVSTDRTQTSEEINTELDLDSSVELVFKTDYVPLNRLASGGDANRILSNTINPSAEAERFETARRERATARDTARSERAGRMDEALHTPAPPDPPSSIDTSRLVPAPTGGAGSGGRGAGGGGGAGSGGSAGGGSASSGSGVGGPTSAGAR